jgi:hypothetical protein
MFWISFGYILCYILFYRFSQKLETPKNETQQERVQKFDGDLDKDKVERAKLSLPQAMKDHAHGDKEVVQGK